MACVRKRRGAWIVDYRIGGRRFTPSFSTKSEAEYFLRELRLRPVDNITGYQEIKEIAVQDAVKQYLITVTPKKSKRTWNVDQKALKELEEYFKDSMIWEISLQNLESYQLKLAEKLNSSTVNRKFNVIKNFFRKCVEWKYLRDNPSENLKRLREVTVQKIPLASNQISKLIDELPCWVSRVFYFIAKTGVRRGEACDLTWDKVDFEQRYIKIGSEKGGMSKVRSIPMTDELFKFVLLLWNEKESASKKSNFVFTSSQGFQVERNKLSKCVTDVGEKLGISNAGLHILRHTILTGLSVQNQSGSAIQKLAGHSSLVTTQKYLHLNNEDVRRSLEHYEKENILSLPKSLKSKLHGS